MPLQLILGLGNYFMLTPAARRSLLVNDDISRLKLCVANGLKIKEEVSVSGAKLLHYAAAEDARGILQTLLDMGADINAVDYSSKTALYTAVQWGNVNCIKILLQRGANPNIPNERGRTPLHLATLNDSADLIALLLANGSDTSAGDEEGVTPLDVARRRQKLHIIALMDKKRLP